MLHIIRKKPLKKLTIIVRLQVRLQIQKILGIVISLYLFKGLTVGSLLKTIEAATVLDVRELVNL